ncbi:DUF354 domain-containing protein [Methanococcus maripaludis]|uniref:Conserved hypothetical archaeal protein n=1 Tax=Methanococcus maripaludis (strain DSM 14266 / JCM 13030 / NBRC 101832 / S2 / LL) TaxID=267377 RepID=Q6M0B3_METMP|nr:DUF354 domain-containing protein [Methanococcus maripaludis]CAF29914.1 conserved hypothetical archaeal protein [Methanococcus maripaludis S2]
MNIAIFINTPAQFHFYRNIAKELKNRGHFVELLFRDYGENLEIAKELGLNPTVYAKPSDSKYGKILSLPSDVLRATKLLKKFKPDIITGFGVYDAFSSFLVNVPCIVFNDSEPFINSSYAVQFKLFMPFTNVLITPEAFQPNFGTKHINIPSYKEFSYLHPNYYTPKEDIFELIGIEKNEEYILLRFNAFDAVHDAGITGFTKENKIKLVKELEKHCKVFISSETQVPKEIEKNILKTPKSRIHDVLYYAKILITDTQTMTTEAALLGTPALRYNKFVGGKDMSNFIELEKNYGLIFNYQNSEKIFERAFELLNTENLKEIWKKKRELLLKNKIDSTSFMVWFFENYPESFEKMKTDVTIYENFNDNLAKIKG